MGQAIIIDTVEEFEDLRACPIGLGKPTISLAQQAANLCNQSTGRFDPNARLKPTAMTDAEFRLQLLEYAEKNIWWLGVIDTKSKLADRLHSGAFRKSDEVAAGLYADLRAGRHSVARGDRLQLPGLWIQCRSLSNAMLRQHLSCRRGQIRTDIPRATRRHEIHGCH